MKVRELVQCHLCGKQDGEHSKSCPELLAMIEIQKLQKENHVAGCNHAYPLYKDGRCMGCGRLP